MTNWMNRFAHRRRLKLVAIFALLASVGIALFVLQPDELSRCKARLTASGEELSLAKLLPVYSTEAAVIHLELSDAAAGLRWSPIAPAEIGLMTKTTNGFARAAWMQPTPGNPAKGTWEEFAVQIAESEPALEKLRRLSAVLPAGSSCDPANVLTEKAKFDFVSRRKGVQFLAGAVVCDLHRGRLGSAISNVNTLVNLASFNDEGDLLVGRMIQVAIAGLAISATWEALQAPGWTEAQLASLQSNWQRIEIARGFARTIEMERAAGILHYASFRTNSTRRGQMLVPSGPGGGKWSTMFFENLYLPFWAAAWSKGDELKFLETMQPLVEAARVVRTNDSFHRMRVPFAEVLGPFRTNQTAFERFRFPIATILIPNWEKASLNLLRCETQRQMVLTALALKRHELRHGQLPADLALLRNEFLPALPADYMNGRHLRYHKVSDGRFKLWSVGENGEDENGAGDDLVWFELEMRASAAAAANL